MSYHDLVARHSNQHVGTKLKITVVMVWLLGKAINMIGRGTKWPLSWFGSSALQSTCRSMEQNNNYHCLVARYSNKLVGARYKMSFMVW